MKEIWMKRRILPILLVILLLLPTAFSRAATTPVAINSDDVRGKVGDTVTVALKIDIEPPKLGQIMDSLQFELVYDSSALEFVDIQEVSQDRISILGVQYMCSVSSKAGAVAFTAAAADGASGSGTLMHIRFRILSPVSTMLVLKKVAYSFVTKSGATQDRRQGGTINLGRITGQSAPATAAPASAMPAETQDPAVNATDQPRFPVTEVTLAPGASPTAEPTQGESDVLAYIVFGLFIIVAILICVVLTLMIVRRGQNKARKQFFEEDEYEAPEEPEADEPDAEALEYEKDLGYEEADEDDPPIKIVRRGKK